MHLFKYILIGMLAILGTATCGKLKLVAFKGHHGGFLGLKVKKPKFLKHGHGGLGGFGGFGGGGFHSHGYEHHESHHSYHSGGFGGVGGFGGKFGFLGK